MVSKSLLQKLKNLKRRFDIFVNGSEFVQAKEDEKRKSVSSYFEDNKRSVQYSEVEFY